MGKILITEQVNGTKANGNTCHENKVLTAGPGGGKVWAGSTYAVYESQSGQPHVQKNHILKDSDDQIIIGFHEQGLPFLIVVDGYFGGGDDVNTVFNFIDREVLSLLPWYSNQLISGADHKAISLQLIKKINAAQKKQDTYKNPAQFTMSMAVTYRQKDKLYCAGFGIGDTGIAIKRKKDGRVEQLVYNVEINDISGNLTLAQKSKDGFDEMLSDDNSDYVMQRNSVFQVEVDEDDEIFGYTWLPESMQRTYEMTITNHSNKRLQDQGQFSRKKRIADDRFKNDENQSLFKFVQSNIPHFVDCDKNAEQLKNKSQFSIGDDCALGSITIPHKEMQNFIVSQVLNHVDSREYTAFLSEKTDGATSLNVKSLVGTILSLAVVSAIFGVSDYCPENNGSLSGFLADIFKDSWFDDHAGTAKGASATGAILGFAMVGVVGSVCYGVKNKMGKSA